MKRIQTALAFAKAHRRNLAVCAWMCLFLSGHPLVALVYLPSFIVLSRPHRHPRTVFFLNVIFSLTPAVLLVLLYSFEKPENPFRLFGQHKAIRNAAKVRNNVKVTTRVRMAPRKPSKNVITI